MANLLCTLQENSMESHLFILHVLLRKMLQIYWHLGIHRQSWHKASATNLITLGLGPPGASH